MIVDKKENIRIVDFAAPASHSENPRKQKEIQVLRHYSGTQETMKHKSDGDINSNW